MEGTKITVHLNTLNTEESWLMAQLFREEKNGAVAEIQPICSTGMKGGIAGCCCTLLAFQISCLRALQ